MDENAQSGPWNPDNPVSVTPDEFEREVVRWLRGLDHGLVDLQLQHQSRAKGISGDYTLDGLATFEIFQGAQIKVLIECKRYSRPVEREVILGLHSRIKDLAAQKAILFSTAGFQRGAIEYATLHGIALVTFIDGRSTYHTKSAVLVPPSYPVNTPKYAGQMIIRIERGYSIRHLYPDDCNELGAWLVS